MISLILLSLLAAMTHFATIAASSNRLDLIACIGFFPIAVWVKHRFSIRFEKFCIQRQFLTDWVSVLILSSFILDLLTNVVNFEPDAASRKAFRNLLYASLFFIPVSIPFLKRSFRFRLPYFILVLILFPPAATTSIPRMGYPSFGFTLTIIALLLVLIKNKKRRYNFFLIGEAWLLIPAALIPLFWTHYIEAPITQVMELLTVFTSTIVVVPFFIRRNQLANLASFLLWFYSPFFLLLFFFPQIFAINSNISSVLIETLIPLCLLAFFERSKKNKWLFLMFALLGLTLIYRIDSQSAIAATIIGMFFAVIAVSLFFLSNRSTFILKNKGYIFSMGLIFTIAGLFIALTYWVQSTTITIRIALWSAVGNALFETPQQFIFGTGGFGYFFHLLQHIKPPFDELFTRVLKIQPWALSHNPHNDYALMLYGGGFLYLLIFIMYTIRTVTKAFQTTHYKRVSLLLSLLTILLIHSLTEPLTSTISTSFIFWFITGLLRSSHYPLLKKSKFSDNILLASTASLLVFLLIGQTIRIPVQQFWANHSYIFGSIRQSNPVATSQPTDSAIEKVIHQINVSKPFFPLDSDLYRQQADLRFYQAIRNHDLKFDYKNKALLYYCQAFERRPIAIHYAGIKRSTSSASSCQFSSSTQLLFERFDPYNFIEKESF